MMNQWAKREMQIGRVIESTAGLYGDLHGIVGRTLEEVKGLELCSSNLQAGDSHSPSARLDAKHRKRCVASNTMA